MSYSIVVNAPGSRSGAPGSIPGGRQKRTATEDPEYVKKLFFVKCACCKFYNSAVCHNCVFNRDLLLVFLLKPYPKLYIGPRRAECNGYILSAGEFRRLRSPHWSQCPRGSSDVSVLPTGLPVVTNGRSLDDIKFRDAFGNFTANPVVSC
jgi:hypothetical protein